MRWGFFGFKCCNTDPYGGSGGEIIILLDRRYINRNQVYNCPPRWAELVNTHEASSSSLSHTFLQESLLLSFAFSQLSLLLIIREGSIVGCCGCLFSSAMFVYACLNSTMTKKKLE